MSRQCEKCSEENVSRRTVVSAVPVYDATNPEVEESGIRPIVHITHEHEGGALFN